MIEFLIFVLGFVAGSIAMFTHMVKLHANHMKHDHEEMAEDLNELAGQIVYVTVELANGEYFAYQRDTGAYLAHSRTIGGLDDELSKKFPSILFVFDKVDEK